MKLNRASRFRGLRRKKSNEDEKRLLFGFVEQAFGLRLVSSTLSDETPPGNRRPERLRAQSGRPRRYPLRRQVLLNE
jgi:hypothetical protein